MESKSIAIFGYGSLMNKESRHETLKEEVLYEGVTLHGYQRIMNACHPDYPYIAMNIEPAPKSNIIGVLIKVPESDMSALYEREQGYELIAITDKLSIDIGEPAFTFIMTSPKCEGKVIKQSYLDKCLAGVPEKDRGEWVKETVINHPIVTE